MAFLPQKQRHQHECLLVAFASYVGVDLERLTQAVGHTGQLPLFADDHSGGGYQPAEIVDALYREKLLEWTPTETWLFVTPAERLFYLWAPHSTTETVCEYAGPHPDAQAAYARIMQHQIETQYMKKSGVVAYDTGHGYYHAMLWDAATERYWDGKDGVWVAKAAVPHVRPCFFFQHCGGGPVALPTGRLGR